MTGPRPSGADTWVVVPCFEEAEVVGPVITALRAEFPHVVCVDDGSTDGSAELARAAGAHVVVHPVNLGQGAAIQTGVEYARRRPGARTFATFDADGQHRVEDLVALVERLGHDELDLVVGTRFAPAGDGAAAVPWTKRVVLRTAVRLSGTTRRLGLTDTHNGLRAFNALVATQLDLTMNGMDHAAEILELAVRHGWRVGEVPVSIAYSAYSTAKGQSLFNGVNVLADGVVRRRLR